MSLSRRSGVAVDAGPTEGLEGVVAALRTTPVKGLRLEDRSEVLLDRTGVADDRSFFLIDDRSRMVNGKRVGILSAVRAEYDPAAERLELSFPSGVRVAGDVSYGEEVATRFFSRTPSAQLVRGPFSEALSDYAGQPLRLVRADPESGGADRGVRGAVSLISQASIERLSGLAGEAVDSRRFRMLIELAGPAAHQEDLLVGARARVGEALLEFHGHVGRCLVTSQHPDTGEVDLPTLELLSYRRGLDTTEPLAFGVYGEVVEPGRIKLGDAIIPAVS